MDNFVCKFCSRKFTTQKSKKTHEYLHCLDNPESKRNKDGEPIQSIKIGKGNSALYNGNFYRSSYEVIVAEYLTLSGVKFNYENITVRYKDENNHSRTKRSDFEIDGEIYEVYGYQDKADSKRAFEENGYKFHLVGPSEIQFILQHFLPELRRRNSLSLNPIPEPDFNKNKATNKIYHQEKGKHVLLCPECSTEFRHNRKTTIYCSQLCKQAKNNRRQLVLEYLKILYTSNCTFCNETFTTYSLSQKRCNKHIIHTIKENNCKTCVVCNKQIVQSDLNRQIYCSEECRIKRATHTCSVCKEKFYSQDPGAKFCSQECSHKNQRRVERPSKEELEKMVWEKPVTVIAEEYGVSDNTVRKWCKKHSIDRPGVGYWAKRRAKKENNILPVSKEELVRLVDSGMSVEGLAAHFRVAVGKVNHWLALHSLRTKGQVRYNIEPKLKEY